MSDLSGFYIVYKGSALTESEHQSGLNHLIEHLVCKSAQKLYLEFDNYAITYNAITSDNYIVYYITGLDEYVRRLKYLFYNEITRHHCFDQEGFLQEKKIVLAEYAMNFSDKFKSYRYNVFRKYLNYNCAIGNKNAIERCDLKQVQEVYNKQYKAPYMIINISKGSPFFTTNMPPSHQIFRNSKLAVLYDDKNHYNKESMPHNMDSKVCMIMSKNLIPDTELYKTQFVNYMLCGNIQKPVYKIFRNDYGLCYYSNVSDYCFDEQHTILFTTETNTKNEEKVYDLFALMMDNIMSYINYELFEKTLSYFKAVKRINEINRSTQVVDLFYNTIFSDNLSKITYDDILAHLGKYYLGFNDNFIIAKP